MAGHGHTDIEFASLLLLAGLIALSGLLDNSAAVIIGAMLISPLMNPILSAALALLLGDGKMGKRAAIVLMVSIAAKLNRQCSHLTGRNQGGSSLCKGISTITEPHHSD